MSNLLKDIKIHVVAPARWLDQGTYDKFSEIISEYGATLSASNQCFIKRGQLAGTDQQRADALNEVLADNTTDVIWCARGGYGSGRILDLLDASKITHSKILIGYSDICLVQQFLYGNKKVISLNGPMLIDVETPEKKQNFDLAAQAIANLCETGQLSAKHINLKPLQSGFTEAPIVTSNLSVLTRLIGTRFEPHWEKCILVIEDIDEYYYAVDRMLLHLRQSKLAEQISGLIIGEFTKMNDNETPWGESLEEMVLHHFGPLGIPISAGFPVGHDDINLPIAIGQNCHFVVTDGAATCDVISV